MIFENKNSKHGNSENDCEEILDIIRSKNPKDLD